MALQYNLAKVYEISENDIEFALQIVTLFFEEVPAEIKSIKVAIEEKDYATQNFLQWFVKEQVEEEDTANGLLEQIKLVNGNPNGLFMMNKELAARTYTPAVIK